MLTAAYFLSCGDRLRGFLSVRLLCATAGAFHEVFKNFFTLDSSLGICICSCMN